MAWKRRFAAVGRFCSQPLVLTVIAGLLGSLLLPALTRQWQDRQAENTLKQGLTEQLATATTATLDQAQFLAKNQLLAAGGPEHASRDDVYALLRDSWFTKRSSIRSQLVIYFPRLYPCWYSFDLAVSSFLSLATGPAATQTKAIPATTTHEARPLPRVPRLQCNGTGGGDRNAFACQLRDYISSNFRKSYVFPNSGVSASLDSCVSLEALPRAVQERFVHLQQQKAQWDNLALRHNDPRFQGAYAIVAEELVTDMDRIIVTISRSSARGYSHGIF